VASDHPDDPMRRSRPEAGDPAWASGERPAEWTGAPPVGSPRRRAGRGGGLLARVAFAVYGLLPEDARAEAERVFITLMRRKYPDEAWRLAGSDERRRRTGRAPTASGHVGGGLATEADVDSLGGGGPPGEDEDRVDD